MTYNDGSPAAVAFERKMTPARQTQRTFIMGFPLESITNSATRDNIMRGILTFLMKD